MLTSIGTLLDRLLSGGSLGPRRLAVPFPSFIEVPPRPVYTLVTRLYNLLAAGLGLLLLSPLLAVLALAVKLTSPGPILYRGLRVGLHEKPYEILKFRTMLVGAEAKIGARLVEQGEDHFTRIGKLLRKYRLDELPQLINVLRGEMNLVGPRPLRPIFLEEHKRTIPGYAKRFLVRPGITGQAQVRGGYYTSPRAKLRYDMLYIAHRSVGFDLKLILLTFIRLTTRIFTTGFILAWLLLALLIVPARTLDLFDVTLGRISFNLLYLVPVLPAAWLLVRREVTDGKLYFLRTPCDLPAVLFALFALLSVAFSLHPLTAFRGMLYYLVTGLTVFYLTINSGIVTRQWRHTVHLLGGVATVIALVGLLELVFVWHSGPGLLTDGTLYRMRSTLGNPLALSALLILALPVILALFLGEERPAPRALWGLSGILVFLSVFLTFTRTALVATFVALWLFLKDRHRKALLLLGVITLVGAFGLSHTGDTRFHPGQALEKAGAELQRSGRLLATFSGQRLLVGVGARSLPAYQAAQYARAPREEGPVGSFRNMFLTLLVEHGLFGFLSLALLVTLALARMSSGRATIPDERARSMVGAVQAGLGGFLVLLLAFDGLRILPLEVLFWAALGFGLGLSLHATPGPTEYYRLVHFRDKL